MFGLALGVIFAIVLGAVGPRLAASTPLAASVRLGCAGFVAVVVVPFLKYPANPPAVGDPSTVNERTMLYFAALALSILLAWAVWRFHRAARLAPTAQAWATAALYAAGLAVIFLALPRQSRRCRGPRGAGVALPARLAGRAGRGVGRAGPGDRHPAVSPGSDLAHYPQICSGFASM